MAASKPQSILLVRFSALGDVAMTIPALYSACQAWPDVKFVLATRAAYAGIFINKPANLTVVPVDLKEKYAGPTGMPRLVSDLAKEHGCQAIVDLHDVVRSQIMRLCGRLKGWEIAKIDKGRCEKKRLLKRARKAKTLNSISEEATHSIERYRQAIQSLGLPFSITFSGLYGQGKGDPALFAKVAQPKAKGEKWVGVAPFAAHASKQCPLPVLRRLVADLSKRGIKVFLFGAGADEQRQVAEWEGYAGVTSIIGQGLGWQGEIALMSHLDAMVTMDSANMHLAALTGIPVVSVWGPTHPCCGFSPWGQPSERMLLPQACCSPCSVFGNKPCRLGLQECMPRDHKVILDKLLPIINE